MRVVSLLLSIFVLSVGAAWAEFEPIPLKTVGLVRTISGVSNIIKTTELQVGDLKTLYGPSLEFIIELDYKGEPVNLFPTDFNIEGLDTIRNGQELITTVSLRCRDEKLPLTVDIDYTRNPRSACQQKSITISPCKAAKGAVIRRVTTESVIFKKDLAPLSAGLAFGSDYKTAFAVVQQKSGKGMCFGATAGKAVMDRPYRLTVYEEPNAPVEKGWQSGKAWFAAVSGTPETAYRVYRQTLLETRYPALAKDSKLGALKKRFAACFDSLQYVPPAGAIDGEGHVADNKGFIFLFNSGSTSAKAVLPLAEAGLQLSGEPKLSDWTQLDKPVDMGVRKLDDKVELDVDARGYRIIGINVD